MAYLIFWVSLDRHQDRSPPRPSGYVPAKYGMRIRDQMDRRHSLRINPSATFHSNRRGGMTLCAFIQQPHRKRSAKARRSECRLFWPGYIQTETRIVSRPGKLFTSPAERWLKLLSRMGGDNIRIMGHDILDGSDWPHSAIYGAYGLAAGWPQHRDHSEPHLPRLWNWTVAPSRDAIGVAVPICESAVLAAETMTVSTLALGNVLSSKIVSTYG